MTTTILLVGHGSRNQAGNDEIREFNNNGRRSTPIGASTCVTSNWRTYCCQKVFNAPHKVRIV